MKLSQYLQYLIDCEHYRLTDLSSKTGIPASDLSNIVKNRRPCGEKNMVKLLNGLDEEHMARALVAWLTDHIPAQYVDLVHIVRADARSLSLRENALPYSVNSNEGALLVLAKQIESNGPLRQVVLNLAKSFAPESMNGGK